jgi:hypothetical protein
VPATPKSQQKLHSEIPRRSTNCPQRPLDRSPTASPPSRDCARHTTPARRTPADRPTSADRAKGTGSHRSPMPIASGPGRGPETERGPFLLGLRRARQTTPARLGPGHRSPAGPAARAPPRPGSAPPGNRKQAPAQPPFPRRPFPPCTPPSWLPHPNKESARGEGPQGGRRGPNHGSGSSSALALMVALRAFKAARPAPCPVRAKPFSRHGSCNLSPPQSGSPMPARHKRVPTQHRAPRASLRP